MYLGLAVAPATWYNSKMTYDGAARNKVFNLLPSKYIDSGKE